MEKINFDINQLLRFLLSGAWAIICGYMVYPSEIEKISEKTGALLFVIALVIGCLIYTFHRAVIYPNLYKFICFILFIFRKVKKWDVGFIIPFFPSKTELAENFDRWKRRGKDNSYSKNHIVEWSSQVHFLYCSASACFYAMVLSNSIGNHSILGYRHLQWLFVLLLSAGIINNIRLILYDIKAKEIDNISNSEASR